MLPCMTTSESGPAPTIDELHVGDDPERWRALGFAVADGCIELGSVRVRLHEGSRLQRTHGAVQRGRERDHVVDRADAVGVRARRLALRRARAGGVQAVEL